MKYVVCAKSEFIRDSQIADLNELDNDEIENCDFFSEKYEDIWKDCSLSGFVSVEEAESEEKAIQKASEKYGYNSMVLYTVSIEDTRPSFMIIAKAEEENVPMNIPYMIRTDKNVQPFVYVKTAVGVLSCGVECTNIDGKYNAAAILMEPEGTDHELVDITRTEIDNVDDIDSDIKIYTFGDVHDENPSYGAKITRKDIQEAFDLNEHF